jgi:hypothetical protein
MAGSGWEDEVDDQGLLNGAGIGANSRGDGICTFDETVVRGFLTRNRLRMIIRCAGAAGASSGTRAA